MALLVGDEFRIDAFFVHEGRVRAPHDSKFEVHGEFALMQPLASDTVPDNVVAIDTN